MKFKISLILILVGSSVFAQIMTRSHRALHSSAPQPGEVNKEAYSKIPDVYRSSMESEINRKASLVADAETVNKFNIEIDPKAWTNNCGRGVIYYNGGCWHKYDKDGRLIQFGNEKEFEELIWCNKRKNELIVEFWKDNKIVDNAFSNAVKNASANVLRSRKSLISSSSLSTTRRRIKEGDNLGRSRMPQSKVTTILEELIPIKDAMKLAKEGKGKGFYQLAVRYARGEELPKDRSAAYKMLRKACDVEYGNAVLIDGLCDESWLVSDLPRGIADALFEGRYMEAAMNRYCGTEFYRERREYDFITNKVAFAEVMGKYEKAKQLGVLVATNQIEALNKRLAEFTKIEEEKAAKIKKAEENRKALLELLGEDKPHDADVEERKRVEEANAIRQERERAERAEQRQRLRDLQEELRKARERRIRDEEVAAEARKRVAELTAQGSVPIGDK